MASGHRLFAIPHLSHAPNTNQISYSTIKFERVGERRSSEKKKPDQIIATDEKVNFLLLLFALFFVIRLLTKWLKYLSWVKWCGNAAFGIHINIWLLTRQHTPHYPSIHPSKHESNIGIEDDEQKLLKKKKQGISQNACHWGWRWRKVTTKNIYKK